MATTTCLKRLVVRIDNDQDCPNPFDGDDGAWSIWSFGRRHGNFKDPDTIGFDYRGGEMKIKNPGLRRKLDVGLAFPLSYYEHGESLWFIQGTRSVPDARWDCVRMAGLLVWEHKANVMGARTLDDRQKDAEGFLADYNAWSNGHVYGFEIETEDGDVVDSHWGFLGTDEVLAEMFSEISTYTKDAIVSVTGPAAWLADHQFQVVIEKALLARGSSTP